MRNINNIKVIYGCSRKCNEKERERVIIPLKLLRSDFHFD